MENAIPIDVAGEVASITLKGKLDTTNAPALGEELKKLMRSGVGKEKGKAADIP